MTFHDKLVLVSSRHDADGLCISFRVHCFPEIIQIEIHLPDTLMPDFDALEFDQHEAFQNAVIENNVCEIQPNYMKLLKTFLIVHFASARRRAMVSRI